MNTMLDLPVSRTARKLRLRVPSALRVPAAGDEDVPERLLSIIANFGFGHDPDVAQT